MQKEGRPAGCAKQCWPPQLTRAFHPVFVFTVASGTERESGRIRMFGSGVRFNCGQVYGVNRNIRSCQISGPVQCRTVALSFSPTSASARLCKLPMILCNGHAIRYEKIRSNNTGNYPLIPRKMPLLGEITRSYHPCWVKSPTAKGRASDRLLSSTIGHANNVKNSFASDPIF